MQVTPALPWSPGSGGTIQLAVPITFDELLANKLTFLYAGDGSGEREISEYDGAAVLKMAGSTFYAINSWEGSSSTIQVLWARQDTDPNMPYLAGVSVNPDLVSVGITDVGGINYLTCTDENGDTVFFTDDSGSEAIVAERNESNAICLSYTPGTVPFGPAQEFPPENYNPIVFDSDLMTEVGAKKAKIKKFITNWRQMDEVSSFEIKVQVRNLVIIQNSNLVSGDESPVVTQWHAS